MRHDIWIGRFIFFLLLLLDKNKRKHVISFMHSKHFSLLTFIRNAQLRIFKIPLCIRTENVELVINKTYTSKIYLYKNRQRYLEAQQSPLINPQRFLGIRCKRDDYTCHTIYIVAVKNKKLYYVSFF